MLIYNVTTNVNEYIRQEWVDWMRNEHIPRMLETGKFSKALMSRVLVKEQMGGITYSVQYHTQNKAVLKQFYLEDAPTLSKVQERFKDQTVSFSTEMQIIDQQ